jgi:hypothetical protein
VVATIASAVHHAHQRGVLHRDLKPSNILVDAKGAFHVTDFGLARRIADESTLTEPDAIFGTPSYMAPEQAAGRFREITIATDVYGLGALLYALLTGRSPFRGDSMLETLELVRSTDPEAPHRLNPRVDRDLKTIVQKAMAKEPSARHGAALDIAKDLENWLAGGPIVARPIGNLVKAWRRAHRNRVLASLLAVIAILLVGGAAGLVVSSVALARKNVEISRQRNRGRQAVDYLYTEFVDRWVRLQPAMERERIDLLEKALGFYEEFAQADDSDPTVKLEIARAALRWEDSCPLERDGPRGARFPPGHRS